MNPSRTREILQVKVTPRAKSSSLAQSQDGTWVAKLKSPPVDGKANEELLKLVAARYKCRKTAIKITSGASGRIKRIQIEMQ